MRKKRRQPLDPNDVPMVDLGLMNAIPNGGWNFTLSPARQTRRVPRGQVQAKARTGAFKSKD